MKSILLVSSLLFIAQIPLCAQPKNEAILGSEPTNIPITKADLGTFPYVKTLPNFTPGDSITIEQNRTYFFDGKTYFTVDGQVSFQEFQVSDRTKKIPSEFQIIQTFDQLVATLGGKKNI